MSSPYIAKPGVNFTLADRPTRVDIYENKSAARDAIKENAKAISSLAHRLYGEADRKLLIVLQGMDTSGKDGTTSAMFHRTPPLNVKVASFKSPTKAELAHDYLWRVHKVVPGKGQITVFNRSHYEVHISPETQGERLRDRLINPDKRWKFNPGDLDDRALWPEFMNAYETMVQKTSTEHAPWHIIPSDSRKTRGAIISGIVRETLENMNPQYPDPGYAKFMAPSSPCENRIGFGGSLNFRFGPF